MDRRYHHSRKTADCGVAKRVSEMKYGYARVSTTKKDENGAFIQSTDLQRNALVDAGVDPSRIYEDRASGISRKRPGLDALLDAVQSGDEVLIWKLDRLGRSARDLLDIAERLKAQGVTIRSIMDGIDTSGSLGGFILAILAAVAELERENIRERVTAGIASSRANGGRIGRKKAMSPTAREEAARAVAGGESVAAVARRYGVDRATVHRALKSEGAHSSAS
jgi:DNA invertase Pin-like site-specific DNA recombinase